MWIRMEYTESITGKERGYTAWVSGSLDDWLEERDIRRENINRLWIDGKETDPQGWERE